MQGMNAGDVSSGIEYTDEIYLALQKQLRETQEQLQQVTAEYGQCKAELKRERLLNEIALDFIPEDQHAEYDDACPHGQPVWVLSSPVKVCEVVCKVFCHL
jgi:hypothetical protein